MLFSDKRTWYSETRGKKKEKDHKERCEGKDNGRGQDVLRRKLGHQPRRTECPGQGHSCSRAEPGPVMSYKLLPSWIFASFAC